MNSESATAEVRPPLSRGRKVLFGLLLLLLVLVVPLGLLEFGLRLAGYGYETDFLLERTVNGRRVFTDNPKFAHRFFPARIARSPQTLLADAEKPAGVTRVVVLGESAALGDPEPAFGLARQLDVLLNAKYPGRRFEVINVAMTAINSHAFPDIARGAAKLGADFWVIYAGNNEFMGPFGPASMGGAAGRQRWLIRLGLALQTTRTGQWLAALASNVSGHGEAPAEFAGLETFLSQKLAPDDPRLAAVHDNFRRNLAEVLDVAQAAGATTVLATPAVNLRDSAPFGSVTTAKDEAVKALLATLVTNSAPEVLQQLDALAAELQQHATLRFFAARAKMVRGDLDGARADFALARDLDALKFRADSRIAAAARELGRERAGDRVIPVDTEALIATNAPVGLPGAETFWEHVHFTFDGNFRLASLVAEALAPKLGGVGLNVTKEAMVTGLAYSDWNRARVADLIQARLQRPPFTDRINSAEQQSVLLVETTRMKPALEVTQFERHAALYRSALERRTNDWMMRDQYAKLLTGFGDTESAVEQWRQVVAEVPHHLIAHYQLGDVLSAKAATAAEAEKHLRAAIALREDFPEAWDRLGQALGQQQKYAEAEVAFARALEFRPSFTVARVNRALVQVGAGRTNDALATLRDAVARDTNTPIAWQNLSRLLTAVGQHRPAAEAAEGLAQSRPRLFAAQLMAAEAWQRVNEPDRAGPHWLEAVRLNPDHVPSRYFLAVELGRQQQFSVAAEQFREVIRRQPALASAHLNLGVVLMQLKRPEEALVAFEKAAELDPADEKAKTYVRNARQILQGAGAPR